MPTVLVAQEPERPLRVGVKVFTIAEGFYHTGVVSGYWTEGARLSTNPLDFCGHVKYPYWVTVETPAGLVTLLLGRTSIYTIQ